MTQLDLIGYLAAIGTTGAFVPQAIKIFRTKKTDDLSPGTYFMLCTGILLWIVYGVFVKSLPIILANGITFIMTSYILATIILHRRAIKKATSF